MESTFDLAALEVRLRHHVAALAQTPRCPATPAHRRAAAYIRAHLEESAYLVQDARFREAGLVGTNLLTSPGPERTLPVLIVGAHYDSVPDSPGADDNASAVAALLELGRWLRPRLDCGTDIPVRAGTGRTGMSAPQTTWPRSRLQLAAYDLEEYGLVGSFVHSREIQEAGMTVRGMISLEMLGYADHRPGSQGLPAHLVGLYPSVGNFIGVVANEASCALLQVVTEAMKSVPGLPVEFIAVPGNGEVLYEARLSDHSSFWDRGYQALMITDTSFFRNPNYHRPSDTAETLDYPFLARVTAGVCEAVWRLLVA